MSKAGDFRMLKLYAVPYGVTARQLREGGRHADCWHVGGTNHDCFVRFDASGTPRLERVRHTCGGGHSKGPVPRRPRRGSGGSGAATGGRDVGCGASRR